MANTGHSTMTTGMRSPERDAASALVGLLAGMLVLLCVTVVVLYMLSGLPSIVLYGIFFAVFVFAIVCGSAFLKTDVQARRSGPPQVEFRVPVRRRRRKSGVAGPAPRA